MEERSEMKMKERIWEENKKIWRVGFPAMLARVTQFGMLVVTQAFIGNLGEDQLAGYALIQIISVRFANGILVGMSSATETLCGQAFGAKQQHMMGMYLQKSWIINFITATLLLPVFIFSSKIFQALGQETQVSEIAGYISYWFIPVLYSFCFTFSVQKFLQTQMKNLVVGWLSAASFVVHVFLSWILVSVLGWGIPGAMTSMIISNWFILVGMLVYVFGGWCPLSWTGFSSAAFSDLFPILKLSISSGVMLCLEFWYNAVLVVLAGYMKNATTLVSAMSICLNVTAWEFMFCFAFLVASSVRVSNELGRGDAKAAKFAIKVIISISISVGIVFFILCLALDKQIARIFTNVETVIQAVSKLSVLLAFSVLLNSFQTVLTGVAVGAGRQSMVAYINITSYYIVGVPLGVVLGYVANLQIQGIWIGMIVGVVMQVSILGYITSTTDWDQQVKRASDRLGRFMITSNDENSQRERLLIS
ncbi:protein DETOXIFICATION 25-like [Euphorbia lathyris]|uniref:protein DETOXIFICATION 25-like n=1 Tax=Euphorbia lathyris TaxID=212925 RepID=UPI0033141B44